ncbi:hypothetical protein [uncultured Flavobacterium sp.]|uniref:hypothetical protein n=1 Tax=uncultured Flavobacterium sp. TaxID=165435 RepID=UPI0030818FC3
MTKNFYFSVFLFSMFSFFAKAQDKVVEFKLADKNKLLGFDFVKNGTVYIVTGREKSPKSEVKIVCYDSLLNVRYSKDILSNYKGLPAFFGRGMNDRPIYYDIIGTTSGKLAIANKDKMVFDDNGNVKDFTFEDIENVDQMYTRFEFFNDDYAFLLGEKINNKKKKKEHEEYQIHRRSLNDFSTQLYDFTPPKFNKEKEIEKWGLGSFFNDRFYMMNKDLNKERTVDIYNILGYNMNSEIISTVSIPLKLENKYFSPSNNGFGEFTIIQDEHTSKHSLSESATGNVYVDIKNKIFYIYGLYSNTIDEDFYNSKFSGFYIFKYSFEGNLIWKIEKEISDEKQFNKNTVAFFMNVDFFYLNDNQFGFGIKKTKDNFAFMYEIDSKKGQITKDVKVTYKVDNILLNGIRGGSFPTGYSVDEIFGDNNVDINTIYANFLNPKVADFFKTQMKSKRNYETSITKNGIFIIEENVKENSFRLMKFN